jgi:hypothetical protein
MLYHRFYKGADNLSQFDPFNPLSAELNPICHLLALLGAHHILHVSRIRVNILAIFLLKEVLKMELFSETFYEYLQFWPTNTHNCHSGYNNIFKSITLKHVSKLAGREK